MWYVKAWKDWKQNGLFSEENIRLAQIPSWSLTVPSTEPQFDESVTITTRMVFIKRNGTSSCVRFVFFNNYWTFRVFRCGSVGDASNISYTVTPWTPVDLFPLYKSAAVNDPRKTIYTYWPMLGLLWQKFFSP